MDTRLRTNSDDDPMQRTDKYQIAALIQGESSAVQVNGITNEEAKRFGLTRETAVNRN
jgi:hypothetical protein